MVHRGRCAVAPGPGCPVRSHAPRNMVMHNKNCFRSAIGALLMLSLPWPAGAGKTRTPLIVTPPSSRLDPGMENILRIMRVGGGLPADRESVFRLNVKEIPEKADTRENTLQIAVRSRIKLFYRPSSLPGKPADARTHLKWVVSAGEGGQGAVLRIANDSAYHVTFTGLTIDGGRQEINADMVP